MSSKDTSLELQQQLEREWVQTQRLAQSNYEAYILVKKLRAEKQQLITQNQQLASENRELRSKLNFQSRRLHSITSITTQSIQVLRGPSDSSNISRSSSMQVGKSHQENHGYGNFNGDSEDTL